MNYYNGSRPVIQALKMTFVCHGIPDCAVSDNEPAFVFTKFKQFVDQWEFYQLTTATLYPQSNEKANIEVELGQEQPDALLVFHNQHIELGNISIHQEFKMH